MAKHPSYGEKVEDYVDSRLVEESYNELWIDILKRVLKPLVNEDRSWFKKAACHGLNGLDTRFDSDQSTVLIPGGVIKDESRPASAPNNFEQDRAWVAYHAAVPKPDLPCNHCRVQGECLGYALRHEKESAAIFGGFTVQERRILRSYPEYVTPDELRTLRLVYSQTEVKRMFENIVAASIADINFAEE